MQNSTKRIFLGIEVSHEWKVTIHQFIEANKSLNYSWIPRQNWHFTVLIIGDFPVDKLNSIYTLFEKCFAQIPAFEIDFEQFTYYSRKQPRMVWCKGQSKSAFALAEYSAFNTLKHFSENAHMEINAKLSKKSIPHITLSRLKFLAKRLPQLKSPNFNILPNPVREIVLFESELKRSGAEYTKLAAFQLRK